MRVEFRYVAVVPLPCGMPDGSVNVYQPGEVIPADILGRSAGHLVLADKVTRMAINVEDDDETPEDEIPNTQTSDSQTSEYPRHVGSGIYQLSDGSNVKGKTKAEQAEAELGS